MKYKKQKNYFKPMSPNEWFQYFTPKLTIIKKKNKQRVYPGVSFGRFITSNRPISAHIRTNKQQNNMIFRWCVFQMFWWIFTSIGRIAQWDIVERVILTLGKQYSFRFYNCIYLETELQIVLHYWNCYSQESCLKNEKKNFRQPLLCIKAYQ